MAVDLFESPTLQRRRYCECCGFPTLFVSDFDSQLGLMHDGSTDWESSGVTCDLCEWESRPLDAQGDLIAAPRDDGNDGITLEQARANYARFGSIYDPDALPEWKLAAPSPAVQEARRTLREAYEALMAAPPGAQWKPWNVVIEAEWGVRDALAAQQAEDEAQVAGAWDDSEELTP